MAGDRLFASRRALLGIFAAAPVTVLTPWEPALGRLHESFGDEPANLRRTKEGRRLSRSRYHNAEAFFAGVEDGRVRHRADDRLYQTGIAIQLGLSAHLLDVGFDDRWCARHVGLRVAKSLAYANATGLGHDDPDLDRLAAVLTPYYKWNQPRIWGEPEPDDGGFAAAQICRVTRTLLNHLHDVTGHSRPSGWGRRSRAESEA